MKRFIALYFLYLGFLFIFLYLPTSPLSLGLNSLQTEFTLHILDYFLAENQRKGIDIWIDDSYKIVITHTCNGLIPLLFFYASVFAYPSKVTLKVFWIFLGYILFSFINILRILWVVFATMQGKGQEDFYWSHDIVGNILLMALGLGLFVLFIRQSRTKRTI